LEDIQLLQEIQKYLEWKFCYSAVSGIVEELSDVVARQTGLQRGDSVMALVGGGGYAEYCAVPYQTVIKIPKGVTLTDAAGLMEVFLTAYQAITWNGHLKDNETILIHAGASGVGLAAVQLCRTLFKNVTIITTAGSEEKVKVCREYGAHLSINYKEQNFAEEVLSFTGNKGVDVILDFVGASYWENHTQCVAVDGRIVLLGLLGGAVTENPLNMGILLKKRVTLVCSTLRSRSLEYKHRLVQEFAGQCVTLFGDGGPLRVPVHQVYPLDQASQAHSTMRTNKNIGKLILEI
jgi:tumor protein p53-inducible protein 3